MIEPQSLIKLFGYNAELINKQTAGMTHAESLLQLPFEGNCLNWILGHIVSTRTTVLKLVEENPVWTDEQRARYRGGSVNITKDSEEVFLLEELVAAYNLSQERLIRGLNRSTYEDMCRPSELRGGTVGDALGYLHFHEAHHVGQILYLAQLAGKKGVYLS